MNLDKYEKIDGREALKRLLAGEIVLDGLADEHFLDGTKLARIRKSGAYEIANDGLRGILERDWYIPKPFDVRQAMLDRPNEWVGKYSVQDEEKTIWYYVGFDSKNFCSLRMKKRNKYGMKEPVKWNGGNVVFAIDDDLDVCIPIEDVPEEATR
ncbi:hypothetical protein IR194_07920 [Exiguobacterium sp. PBE]|nr:hypothetical protein IR194_07920 [Exiguobacterium sp. PBE]